MSGRLDRWCLFAGLLGLAALLLPPTGREVALGWFDLGGFAGGAIVLVMLCAWLAGRGVRTTLDGLELLAVVAVTAWLAAGFLHREGIPGEVGLGFWLLVLALWAAVWRGLDRLAAFESLNWRLQRIADLSVPILFGLWLLFLWEAATVGFDVPQVLLPPPSMIAVRLVGATDILWADFQQTFLQAVLAGYALGCGSGLVVAILVDRVPFLKRGLLPLGNLVSALPIVGVAPIMVMWFGFDWQSKAAVVVIMTFFPMLVNTVTGLAASSTHDRELMQTYAAGYWQTLFKLRLPAAMPFVFNALKINSTLALIGAIVAEFFGTPIVGMGFRISTEVGRMNIDMVWAEIVMAAVAGSAFYGLTALAERTVTFWHPSYRRRN